MPDNNIFYSEASEFCNSVMTALHPLYIPYCLLFPGKYIDLTTSWTSYIGKMNPLSVPATKWQNMPICPDNSTGMNNSPACKYDLGRGMIFSVAGTEIKNEKQKFIKSTI